MLLLGATAECYCWVLLWVAATCPEASQLLELDVRVSIPFSSGAYPFAFFHRGVLRHWFFPVMPRSSDDRAHRPHMLQVQCKYYHPRGLLSQ